MSRTSVVAGFAALVAGLTLLSVPAPAAATPVAGENGRIVLSSGRNLGDAARELFLLPTPFSGGLGGTISAPVSSLAGQTHRHPTWSPDRTKIAYARGPAAGPFDIFVQDLTQPLSATNPVNITQSATFSEDRPAWAPNGTHIAWEQSDVPPTQREVIVALTNGGGQTNITAPAGGFAGKPAWHPFSSTIFYEDGNPFSAVESDIVKRSITFGPPITVGAQSLAVAESGESELQPYIAPSGDRLCYTQLDPAVGLSSGQLKVALLTTPASPGGTIATDPAADYNCVFSPDSTLVAYVNGTGVNNAQLMVVRADGSQPPDSLSQDPGADNFDGNPDWAPDGRPQCPNSVVQATTGVPLSIPVECVDTGPEYERSNVRESIIENPTNGTAEQDLAGDPVIYTSNAGFTGIDSFEIRSFDTFGFGADRGTVTVQVVAPEADPNVDTTAPETTIIKGPKPKSRLKPGKKKKGAKFTLASSEANSTFECSVDGKAFVACGAAFKVKVKKGRHTLNARATDAAGNTDQTPALYKWKVKKAA